MIYLIFTTCISSYYGTDEAKDENTRMHVYSISIPKTIDAISKSEQLRVNILPIIVENNGERPTPFDIIRGAGIQVVYTDTNKNSSLHKAEKELADLKEVIRIYNIQDDDIIIKMTGRYFVNSPIFFDFVKQQENNFDVIMKFMNICTQEYTQNDCILGLYAIRCKYLKQFNYTDFTNSAEVQFATWIRENIQRICEVYTLDMVALSGEDMTLFYV